MRIARWATLPVLATLLVAGVAFFVLADDDFVRGVWIGAAFTALAALVVDGLTLLDQAMHRRKVLRVMQPRLRRCVQHLTLAIRALFGGGQGDPLTLAVELESLPDGHRLDLSTPANIFPPRSRQALVVQMVSAARHELELLTLLSTEGELLDEVNFLSQFLEGSSAGMLMRDVAPVQTVITMSDGGSAAREAAIALRTMNGWLIALAKA